MSLITIHPDVKAKVDSMKNTMSAYVKEHFFNPKNLVKDDSEIEELKPNGIGIIGSAGCGDNMSMWLKIEEERIKVCKWFTTGCGSAISSSSILSVMLTEDDGMKVDGAMKITTDDILNKLGEVNAKKVHCSILCVKALREAINDYYKKTKQYEKIVVEGARIIDNKIKLTDKQIEEGVLNGARDLSSLQYLLNIEISEESKNKVDQLIEYYGERYK